MSILEELDACHDRKLIMQMCMLVTDEKHSVWFINLLNERGISFPKVWHIGWS